MLSRGKDRRVPKQERRGVLEEAHWMSGLGRRRGNERGRGARAPGRGSGLGVVRISVLGALWIGCRGQNNQIAYSESFGAA